MASSFEPSGSLTAKIPEAWLINPDVSWVLIRAYSSSLLSDELWMRYANNLISIASALLASEIKIYLGKLAEGNKKHEMFSVVTYQDGLGPVSHTQILEIESPPGDCLVMMSPLYKTETTGGVRVGDAETAMTAARGLFSTFLSSSSAEQRMLEVSYDPADPDKLNFTGAVWMANPLPDQHIFTSLDAVRALARVRDTEIPEGLKKKLPTCFLFLGKACNEIDGTVRFSHLWIAAEMIVGGYKRLRDLCKSLESSCLGKALAKLRDRRNHLFHSAVRFDPSHSAERLLHLLVVKVIYRELSIVDTQLDLEAEAIATAFLAE